MKKRSLLNDKTILLVGPIPPPMGGMSMQTLHFYQRLKREGKAVQLIPSNPPLKPSVLNKVKGLRTLIRILVQILALNKHLRKSSVVHLMANSGWSWFLTAMPTLMLAKWHSVPCIVNYRGGNAESFLKRYGTLVNLSLRHAYKIVVPSRYLAEVFQAQGYRTTIIPNTVDTHRFKPSEGRKASCHCLVARNLDKIYGVDLAIHALYLVRQTHPKFHLSITGEGEQKRSLMKQVKQLGLQDHVHFLGRLSRVQMAKVFADCDMLLNPSRVDNMPNALLEAQAAGVPIITSSVGGIPFMVEANRTAILVEPDNVQALARAMIALYEDQELRKRLVASGLENIKQFTWPVVRSKWDQVYEQAS